MILTLLIPEINYKGGAVMNNVFCMSDIHKRTIDFLHEIEGSLSDLFMSPDSSSTEAQVRARSFFLDLPGEDQSKLRAIANTAEALIGSA